MDCPKVAVAAAYAVMIVMNGLSFTGIFGESVGVISAENPTWITPDGVTFAIWSVIYTLQLLLVVRQCCPSAEEEKLLEQPCCLTGLPVRWRLVLAFLLNAAWLPIWSSLNFWLALAVIASNLGVLISVYTTLNSMTAAANFCQWLSMAAPIATNASWLVVATSANVFTIGRYVGWEDDYGIGGSSKAAGVVVIFATALAVFLACQMRDGAWGLVAAWAFAGIYRMQTVPNPEVFPVEALSPALADVAAVCAGIAGLASVGALLTLIISWCQAGTTAAQGYLPQV